MLAIIKAENGRNEIAIKNKNDTIDYGVMQINSIWLSKIAPYGYKKEDLQFNPYKNVEVGTWILSQNIASSKTLWSGVGNYHSHNHDRNLIYRNKISDYDKILSKL